MGIDGLGRLIKLSPEIAEQHQLAVIDCLEVGILFSMMNDLFPITLACYVHSNY